MDSRLRVTMLEAAAAEAIATAPPIGGRGGPSRVGGLEFVGDEHALLFPHSHLGLSFFTVAAEPAEFWSPWQRRPRLRSSDLAERSR